MTLRAEVDGSEYLLDLTQTAGGSEYKLNGVQEAAGQVSVVETMPGVYSVLLNNSSFQVRVAPRGEELEVWTGAQRHIILIADARDRFGHSDSGASGPQPVKATMPGKIIRILVDVGDQVDVGQGLIIVEAMKMQNEMKSPKSGVISKICVMPGVTVTAGEVLLVVE